MSAEYRDEKDGATDNAAQDSSIVDHRYYRGPLGILKFCEMVLSLIGFICVTTSLVICLPWFGTAEYFKFATMAAFVTTLILYVILLFKLDKRVLKCACIKWPKVLMVYYAGVVIFLFFGDLFLSIHGCSTLHQAGVAFGWLAWIAYVVDLVLAVLAFRKELRSPS